MGLLIINATNIKGLGRLIKAIGTLTSHALELKSIG